MSPDAQLTDFERAYGNACAKYFPVLATDVAGAVGIQAVTFVLGGWLGKAAAVTWNVTASVVMFLSFSPNADGGELDHLLYEIPEDLSD